MPAAAPAMMNQTGDTPSCHTMTAAIAASAIFHQTIPRARFRMGGCDECNHGGAHSLEGGIHVTVLADVREIDGYEQDDDERREYHARHGREGAPVAGYLVADEYGRVEGYRAGSRLGQRKQFEKVTACYPAAPVYHLPFDEGYHGEASSEGESTYFEKGREEREAYPQAACTLRLYVAYVP